MELRRKTIPIFFDMIQCEFMNASQPGSKIIKKNFITVGSHIAPMPAVTLMIIFQFEHELISRLDALIGDGKGDEQYKELFYEM
jgi:hypothetical protein